MWLGEGGCVLRPRTMAPSGGGVVQADAHRHAVVSHHRDRHRRRIISPYRLRLKPKLIVQQYEIWRLVTNFLYFGKWVGLKLASELHTKAATAKGTVHESYIGGSFGFVCQLHWKSPKRIQIWAPNFEFSWVFEAGGAIAYQCLTLTVYWRWHRLVRTSQVLGGGTARFSGSGRCHRLHYFSSLVGLQTWPKPGMIAGHAYYFLEDVYPLMQGHRPLRTPFIKNIICGGKWPNQGMQNLTLEHGMFIKRVTKKIVLQSFFRFCGSSHKQQGNMFHFLTFFCVFTASCEYQKELIW
ncbi:unnamed protein product [Musa acuminata subsp. malaccensis]|uniref:Derlin n=1 Tax=Musa acuminata subsp. malaccensis TaxID=214687 RepID=A0A804JD55_MUSAM|nr:unnamed protein product [Musa acuminata subsp. malaccensis]